MTLFVNVVWTFKYSLARTAFPKTKNLVICTKLPMGAKFHFCEWKIYFSQFIFIDKYLKFNEIEYPVNYVKFEMWAVLFYVNTLHFPQ